MWYAIIIGLWVFCYTVDIQQVNSLWYEGNYINTYLEPREQLIDLKYQRRPSANLLQSYRDFFRPHFRCQYRTYIKFPFIKQAGRMDFRCLKTQLSPRTSRFEEYPQYIRLGKQFEASKLLSNLYLPKSKVLMNPFVDMKRHSGKGRVVHITSRLENNIYQNEQNSAMKVKEEARESQDFNIGGMRKRIPNIKRKYETIRKIKKSTKNCHEIPSTKICDRFILPSKIVISDFGSWDHNKKNEIRFNNLSFSMIYNLVSPKTTSTKQHEFHTSVTLDNELMETVTFVKAIPKIFNLDFGHRLRDEIHTISDNLLNQLAYFDNVTIKNNKTEGRTSNGYVSCTTDQHFMTKNTNYDEHIGTRVDDDRKKAKYMFFPFKKTNRNNKTKVKIESKLRELNSIINKYELPWHTERVKSRSTASTEAPILFKFDDYLCECHRCTSNHHTVYKRMKVHENNNRDEIKEAKSKLLKKIIEDGLTKKEMGEYSFTNEELNTCDDTLLIPSDEVLDVTDKDYTSISFDTSNKSCVPTCQASYTFLNNRETLMDNLRCKRRTFKCRASRRGKRKRAFVSVKASNNPQIKKKMSDSANISRFLSPRERHRRIRKMNKHKKSQLASADKNVINEVFNSLRIRDKNRNLQNNHRLKVNIARNKSIKPADMHKKREFVSVTNKELIECTDVCEELIETSTSRRNYTSHLKSSSEISEVKSTIKMTSSRTEIVSRTNMTTTHKRTLVTTPKTSLTTGITTHKSILPAVENQNPVKILCEKENKAGCMCYLTKALRELNDIITSNDDQHILLDRLAEYNCSDYKPMEANFKMSSDLKPRLISNKHKELLVDEKNGPKEIIGETFEELMLRGIPNEGIDFYVFPSATLEIPCFINNDVQLSPNIADSASYVWKRGDNKEITGGRVTEDLNHRGMLQILEATLADSDNYTCFVNYTNPDTEQVISDSFVHSAMVVTLPKFALHTLLHYDSNVKCDQETLEMFELYLPQQIEELICYTEPQGMKICSIEIHNPMCHPKNSEVLNESPKSVWKFQTKWVRRNSENSQGKNAGKAEISLNFELDFKDITQTMSSVANRTRCGPFCQLKVVLKVIETVRESFILALGHRVNSSGGMVFEPDVQTINMKILIACEGGFRLTQGFCMPCPTNTYSEEGSTECSECPRGTFQPNIGSRSCEKCTNPFKSGCSILWISPGVIALTTFIALMFILMSALLFYGCKIFIGSTLYSCITGIFKKKKKMKPNDVSHRSIKRKSRKPISITKHEDSSEPPTPPAEDFTN